MSVIPGPPAYIVFRGTALQQTRAEKYDTEYSFIILGCGQDEVAQRLTAASPGGSDYRAMNIEVGFYSQPRYVFKIDRTAYFPQPKVHGALVDFALRSPSARHPLPTSDTDFLKMVSLQRQS